MTTRDWEFDWNGRQYTLKMTRGWSHRRFFLNGSLLLEQKERGNRQVSYSFEIDEGVCEVNFPNIWVEYGGYYYSCFWNNVLIPSAQDKRWRRKIERSRFVSGRIYWFEVAKALNLKPILAHPELGYTGKPLVGDVRGFLTLIYFGRSEQNVPLVHALVRYNPVREVKSIKTDLAQVLSRSGIMRKSPVFRVEPLTNDHAVISWLFNPKKLSAEQLKRSLDDVLAVFSKHTSGISPFKCENPTCKYRADTNLKLVLVNGFPRWFCAACVTELNALGSRAKENYEQTPSNFGRGLAVGFLAALLGSLVWAAWMILFNQITAAISLFILFGVVKAMDWVKTKRTFWSILAAGLLSVGGSILGSYLGGLWLGVTKGGVSLAFIFDSLANFLWYLNYVWHRLWENTTVMNTTIVVSLLGVGFYLWALWSNQRKFLKQAFKPEIHVVE